MPLNQVQVVGPRSSGSEQKAPKKTDLERVMEGLQLANSVLGIGSNIQSIRANSRTIDAKDYEAAGGISKTEEIDAMAKGGLRVPVGTEGSVKTGIRTPEGKTEYIGLVPPKPKTERVPTRVVETPGPDGKPVQKIVEDVAGGQYPAYQKPEPKKEDKTAGNTADLRKEYNSQKTTQNSYQVVEAYNKIQGAAKGGSPTDDMSLIYGFMKMQDPGSTVREGEYASAENTRGIPATVLQAYNKAIDGQRLAPEQRANFLSSAEGIYDAQLKAQETVDKRYESIAKQFNTDPQFVLEPQFQATRAARVQQTPGQGRLGGSGMALGAPKDAVPGADLNAIDAELKRRGLKPRGASGGY